MENVKLMNMCKIIDNSTGKILVQKRIKGWKGIAFPGGKVEKGESLYQSVKREIKEETGLCIKSTKIMGIKNWYNSSKNERCIVILFETSEFSGNLTTNSEEGENSWIFEKNLKKEDLADNFDVILKLYNDNNKSEMIYDEFIKNWVLL